ncbi:MAG: hypothetical protein HY043_17630 [Verrucomicrobia bacterium]|nr:hypothetical protein [Verrucomicrobiota bacterium]
MTNVAATNSSAGRFAGLSIALAGVGKVALTQLLGRGSDTYVFLTSYPGLVVKLFDLECGKPDEVSYGPYLSYNVEVENFEDIKGVEELRLRVPAYYGANLDAERKFAFIAMEYLEGLNLLAWSQAAAEAGYPETWADEFRAALHETLSIVKLFHDHGIVLIDFKPDNVIRLFNGAVKFVDLGAFFTPRHSAETDKYVYAATPDYAELVIDTSNVQTGMALTQGSDIFSAGVALFELATGNSRLAIAPDSAAKMLGQPGLYRFRDSQIKDVWHAYPHLKELLPLVQTQLQERRILFAELWHLLKGFLASEVADWDSLPEEQHREMILATGTDFIADQLPPALKWLATPIARATTLRSFRLKNVVELMELISDPVAEDVEADIAHENLAFQMAPDLDPPVAFHEPLNRWEVRFNPQTEHWAINVRLAALKLRSIAPFTFLKEIFRDNEGHRFFQFAGDSDADDLDGHKLTLENLANDPAAWLGA